MEFFRISFFLIPSLCINIFTNFVPPGFSSPPSSATTPPPPFNLTSRSKVNHFLSLSRANVINRTFVQLVCLPPPSAHRAPLLTCNVVSAQILPCVRCSNLAVRPCACVFSDFLLVLCVLFSCVTYILPSTTLFFFVYFFFS